MTPRTYLYVPGDQPRKLDRAPFLGADALVLDLEDSVSFSQKAAARREVAGWLERADTEPDVEVWVRVNGFDSPEPGATAEDVAAVVGPSLTGIVLAKCGGRDDLAQLEELLAAAEQRARLAGSAVGVAALVESAVGLLAARELASWPRMWRLHAGEVDLCASIGVTPGPDEVELVGLRTQLVLACAAAGLEAPVGPVSLDFHDLDSFRAGTERLRRLGFGARAVIHPAQVQIANEVFTPSPDEEAAALAAIERFETAAAQGSGVVLDERGRMVDQAVVRSARSIAARAEHARRRSARRPG